MTLDLIRDLASDAMPPAPPAVHLFGAIPHDVHPLGPVMPRLERDHFAARFAHDFAAALTEAKAEPLAS